MILYSPAKINIGLYILRKREDNFHDLSSLMYPLPFYDIIEIQVDFDREKTLSFTNSGIIVPDPADSNLCSKAVHLFISATGRTAEVNLHLHKQIPYGAGLGGGSSNASTVLLAMNKLAGSPLKKDQLAVLAAQLGSDCPLFIYGKPMMASGRGEILEKAIVDLSGYFVVLLDPNIAIPTPEAYEQVSPNSDRNPLSNELLSPMNEWKNKISNDFEDTVFSKYPLIRKLKNSLYDKGAIYASMSGSGSAVYGLFKKQTTLPDDMKELLVWKGFL